MATPHIPACDGSAIQDCPRCQETARPFDLVGFIMAFEDGTAEPNEIIDGFAHLVKTGTAWTLQGMYGRAASRMIEAGYIDRQGNVLHYPSQD